MDNIQKRLLFVFFGFLAGSWPTSVLMGLLRPYIDRLYVVWFHSLDADDMMDAVLQSQYQVPASPFVEIPETMIDVPNFLPQLFAYTDVDDLCGQVQYPNEASHYYRVCLLDKTHTQPHCTYAPSDAGGIETDF
jgi:hypothetical protein